MGARERERTGKENGVQRQFVLIFKITGKLYFVQKEERLVVHKFVGKSCGGRSDDVDLDA